MVMIFHGKTNAIWIAYRGGFVDERRYYGLARRVYISKEQIGTGELCDEEFITPGVVCVSLCVCEYIIL